MGRMESMAQACPAEKEIRERVITDAVIRFAGHSQDGIQSVGVLLATVAGRSGMDVMTYMAIPATIAGGASIFQVRLSTEGVRTAGDELDCLAALRQDSYDSSRRLLRQGGVLIFDSDEVKPADNESGACLLGVPIGRKTAEALGSAQAKGRNLFTLGLVTQIYSLDRAKLRELLRERFGRKGDDVLAPVLAAFDAGLAHDLGGALPARFRFPEARAGARPKITLDGNQAVAYGAIAAGIRHAAAYPITPSTGIMEALRDALPRYGGIQVQSEDEIAAVCTAIGFSYAGHVALTSTSGPGFSLKQEALGAAVMMEVPLVVVDVQRGGPSTGMPTRVEQSDLLAAIHGSHGDTPRIVLAARNIEDCFYLTIEAARIARKYSTPVILLTDQSLATRFETIDEPDVDAIMVDPRPDLSPRGPDFRPYPLDGPSRHAPPGARVEGGRYPVLSGLEHNEWGHPAAGQVAELHPIMTARRRRKLELLAVELPDPEIFGDPKGDLLLISWGSSWGPTREAVRQLRDGGASASHLHLTHLNPLPARTGDMLAGFRQIATVELNDGAPTCCGQLGLHLRGTLGDGRIGAIRGLQGKAFKVGEIVHSARVLLKGAGGKQGSGS